MFFNCYYYHYVITIIIIITIVVIVIVIFNELYNQLFRNRNQRECHNDCCRITLLLPVFEKHIRNKCPFMLLRTLWNVKSITLNGKCDK